MCKRIVSFLLGVVICFSITPVSRAEYTSRVATFGEVLLHSAVYYLSGIPIVSPTIQGIASLLDGDICDISEDGYHYGETIIRLTNETDEYGRDVGISVCKYCGDEFHCYVSDIEAAYDSQVADLPATGVTSSGGLIYTVYPSYMWIECGAGNRVYSPSSSRYDPNITVDFSFNMNEETWSFDVIGPVDEARMYGFSYYFIVSLPFDCSATLISNAVAAYSFGAGSELSLERNAPSGLFAANQEYYLDLFFGQSRYDYAFQGYLKTPLVYSVIPTDASIVTNNYTIDSRPTSITGDYGIIGDNGQISNVGNTTIVNETNNTFTNPSTGTTSTITEWTYDYSDRSYNLTLDTGDTVTVTYGDENVTIQEGDTIYNVYYIINGSGEGTDPDACQHDYTSTVDREAACTVPGQITYTCSLCGDTYIEAIPAKGHSWTVLQTVTTEYDEQGSLIRQGYTLYECSVCGEQYKDETGTGPPDSGGGAGPGEDGESVWDKLGQFLGTVFGGFIGFVEAFLGAILDALISLATMIGEKTAAVVELILRLFTEIPLLFTGFLSFLSAVFPFFPEEIMLLLTFGIAVVVFIGIIKELRR